MIDLGTLQQAGSSGGPQFQGQGRGDGISPLPPLEGAEHGPGTSQCKLELAVEDVRSAKFSALYDSCLHGERMNA